jgi:hypothetical protein
VRPTKHPRQWTPGVDVLHAKKPTLAKSEEDCRWTTQIPPNYRNGRPITRDFSAFRLALTLAENDEISSGIALRRSARSMAGLLGRSPSQTVLNPRPAESASLSRTFQSLRDRTRSFVRPAPSHRTVITKRCDFEGYGPAKALRLKDFQWTRSTQAAWRHAAFAALSADAVSIARM